jgi:hypothetical protein
MKEELEKYICKEVVEYIILDYLCARREQNLILYKEIIESYRISIMFIYLGDWSWYPENKLKKIIDGWIYYKPPLESSSYKKLLGNLDYKDMERKRERKFRIRSKILYI